jgi:acyl-CoA thioesterase
MSSDLMSKRCEELVSFFNRAPLKHAFGMIISYKENGDAIFDMPHNPSFDHTMGGIYGGVVASMIDNAGWYTAAAHTDNWVSTVNLNIQLLEPAAKTAIRSVGELVRAGKRLAYVNAKVFAGDKLIAIGSGNFSISSIPRATIK